MQSKLKNCQFIIPDTRLSGFHNYGTNGIIVKQKLLNHWRHSFLKNSNIKELETPAITPYSVLKASGHVDRFTDYIVFDEDGNSYRADHLVKDFFVENKMEDLIQNINVDTLSLLELEEVIKKYNMLGEHTNKCKVTTKNLMFGVNENYLRPELAQGLFVTFKQYNQSLPFGLAQTGKAYRNEIACKQFTRMREFTLAEIEYFVDPENKTHPKYNTIKDTVVPIYSKADQLTNEPVKHSTIDYALNHNIIGNELIGYFIAKIYQFVIDIGLDKNKIRFRQHQDNELAHYALECWDLEAYVSNNWLECIGCSDRGSYDLKAHKQYSQKNINPPITKKELLIKLNRGNIGRRLKEDSKIIIAYLSNYDNDTIIEMFKELKVDNPVPISINNITYNIDHDMLEIIETEKKIYTKEFYAHTIEPSFGIDRLLYAIFEHNFWAREIDVNRTILSLPDILVPYDVAILQLYNKPEMLKYVDEIVDMFDDHNYSCYTDSSHTTIGKRYSRMDEIGIKYTITIDHESVKSNIVTIRDRDTMKQIYVEKCNILDVFKDINKLNF